MKGCGDVEPGIDAADEGKLEHGGTLAEQATAAGSKVETASGFRRDASLPGVPASVVTAAFRTAKDGESDQRS